MAMPIYAMSCFKLTKDQCTKITSAMSSFWWNSCEDKKKMHWVAWEKLCRSKQDGGIGFRDLGNFNQALLAKQAWRLLTVPNSLIARIYKSRYFSKKCFMEAGAGYRPSYAWRSICFGRELLSKGVMKSIGNGLDTHVWFDKWVFDEVPRKPISTQRTMDLNLKVADLIDPGGQWNLSLLQSLFPPMDVTRISSIPPNIRRKDSFIWAYTRDGFYSVKSGNWFVTQPVFGRVETSAQTKAANELKAKVWSMKTIPKIRMFLWRVLSGALAVADCLTKHELQTPLSCKLCHRALESASHVLFECIPASVMWNHCGVILPPAGFSSDLFENFKIIFTLMEDNRINDKLRLAIPWWLWGLWKHRNDFVFEGKQGDINVLISVGLEEAELWARQQEQSVLELRQASSGAQVLSRKWSRPEAGRVKCNAHFAWSGSSFMVGGAWIIRDNAGVALFHSREAFTPTVNKFSAELRGFVWVLQCLKDLHITNCEVWADSAAAVGAINNISRCPRYRNYLDQIHHLLQEIQGVVFLVSSPQANRVAQEIAKSVTRDGWLRSYLSRDGPAWLQSRIVDEMRVAGVS